jgi:hypothetical protein
MSQKLTQITEFEPIGITQGKSDNVIISSEFANLLKCGEKPTKKSKVKKTPNKKQITKTQLVKESIVCKYGFLLRMNNQLGFKVIKGSYLK